MVGCIPYVIICSYTICLARLSEQNEDIGFYEILYIDMELDEMRARWILLHHGKVWDTFDKIYLQQVFSALDGIVTRKSFTIQTIHAAHVESIQCNSGIYYNYMVSYNTYENCRRFR